VPKDCFGIFKEVVDLEANVEDIGRCVPNARRQIIRRLTD